MSNKELTPHPKADILRAIADGKPVQMRSTKNYEDNEWWEPSAVLQYIDDKSKEFRIKPETMTLSGHEFPAPVREPLPVGTLYWQANIGSNELETAWKWSDHDVDKFLLRRALIQLTKEGAIAQAKAMIAAVGGEV